MFKFNNRNNRKLCEIVSRLTVMTLVVVEYGTNITSFYSVTIVGFEHLIFCRVNISLHEK